MWRAGIAMSKGWSDVTENQRSTVARLAPDALRQLPLAELRRKGLRSNKQCCAMQQAVLCNKQRLRRISTAALAIEGERRLEEEARGGSLTKELGCLSMRANQH